jgi:protein gp37
MMSAHSECCEALTAARSWVSYCGHMPGARDVLQRIDKALEPRSATQSEPDQLVWHWLASGFTVDALAGRVRDVGAALHQSVEDMLAEARRVSVESQKWLLRADALRETPAAVRFLSCEPLLGPLEFGDRLAGIDWVIAGGESGPRARPMHPDWARSLRDQCIAAAVPFLFKQWGAWRPSKPWRYGEPLDEQSGRKYEWMLSLDGTSFDAKMWRVGKHAAGRELDGRTWDEFPTVSA